MPSNITVGATRGIGLIDYTLGYARILIFSTSVCTISGTVPATTSATADATHFHVGALDLIFASYQEIQAAMISAAGVVAPLPL